MRPSLLSWGLGLGLTFLGGPHSTPYVPKRQVSEMAQRVRCRGSGQRQACPPAMQPVVSTSTPGDGQTGARPLAPSPGSGCPRHLPGTWLEGPTAPTPSARLGRAGADIPLSASGLGMSAGQVAMLAPRDCPAAEGAFRPPAPVPNRLSPAPSSGAAPSSRSPGSAEGFPG